MLLFWFFFCFFTRNKKSDSALDFISLTSLKQSEILKSFHDGLLMEMLYIQTPYGTFYKISLLCSRRDSSLKHQKEEKKQYGSFIKLSHMTFELYCKASDVMICLRNRPKFKQLFSKKLL